MGVSTKKDYGENTLCIIVLFVCNSFMSNVPLEDLVSKNMSPPFIPRGDVLHCDPTHELEEVCSIDETSLIYLDFSK